MKKHIFFAISLALLLFCVTSASGEDLKVIKLVYSNNAPAQAGGNIFFEKIWLPKINEELAKVGYQLEITSYHASSLYKYTDQVNACEKGLIDITNFIASWEEARAPLHMVLYLPLMGFTVHSNIKVWFDLQNTIPEFGAEFAKYKELFHFSADPNIFNSNKEQLRVPADFKGMKVGCTGALANLMRSVGASPLRIDAPDRYTSIDRGLIDVLPLGIFSITMWKLHEVAKVHTLPTGDSLGMVNMSYIMGRKQYDKLPAEVRKVIDDHVDWASKTLTTMDEENSRKSLKMVEDLGNKVIRLTPEEMALWHAAAKPVQEQWVAEMEGKKLPGQKVYSEAVKLIQQYEK